MNKKLFSILTLLMITFAISIIAPPQSALAQDDTIELFSDPDATDNHCGYTDETAAGSFYVSGTIETENLNYQNVDGEPITISGAVYDGSIGEPIPNAKIEVWQADANGDYYPNAEGDVADFTEDELNLRGTVLADDEGAYQFTTIKPAIDENRLYISYHITAEGYLPLFTQTYWLDDPTIEADSTDTEACRILTFEETEDGETTSSFDIYLRPDLDYVAAEATTEAVEAITCAKLDLNNLTEDALLATIPNFSNRMVREFFEYRPYVSIQQFRREIGKYVDDAQVAEWEQYVYVPVAVNDSDAATLMQLPGVDDTVAAELIAARPYDSNAAFLEKLSEYVDAQQLTEAGCYLS